MASAGGEGMIVGVPREDVCVLREVFKMVARFASNTIFDSAKEKKTPLLPAITKSKCCLTRIRVRYCSGHCTN